MAITAERLEIEVRAEVDRAISDLNRLNRSTGQSGNTAAAAGKKFRGASMLVKAAAGTMAASIATKTITAASDLNEVLSKTDVVFGPASKRVTKAADEMAKQFGISKTTFLDAASGLGLVAKASGLTEKAAGKTSVQMAKLAADAASFYNVPIDEALAAMKSGLVGEAEPMRRFGVLLSEAAVKTEAARLGIAKMSDELTEGQKVQARTSLIMRGMSDASGDLARTQESVANRVRELQGRLVNFAADMGTKALPAVEKFLGAVVDKGIPKMQEWAQVIEDKVLPPLVGLAKIGGSLVGFLNGLPGPVKSAGLQFAVMALAISKTLPVMAAAQARVASMTTTIGAMSTRMLALKGGAVAVAGAGLAMGQMADKTTESGKAMGHLGNIMGGAGIGFLMGGPAGAAVGFLAGTMASLASATGETAESFNKADVKAGAFRDTLDQLTGAITRQTRVQALQEIQETAAIRAAKALGVQTRDLVGATLGQEGATQRVNKAIRQGIKSGQMMTYENGAQGRAADALSQALFGVDGMTAGLNDRFRQQQRELKRNIRDTKTWNQALKGVPKDVKVRLKQMGYQANRAEIRDLRKEYDLTPKQVRTIIKAVGTKAAKDETTTLGKLLDTTGRKHAKPQATLQDKAKKPIQDIVQVLESLGRKDARPSAHLNDQASAGLRDVFGWLERLNGKTATTYVRTVRTGGERGFADGGYTGDGGKHEPAGIVHRGEFVVRKGPAQRFRGRLEAMNRGLPGYASGGAVGERQGIQNKAAVDALVRAVRDGTLASKRVWKGLERIIKRETSGKAEAGFLGDLSRMRRLTARASDLDDRLQAATARRQQAMARRSAFSGQVRAGISAQANVLNAGNNAGTIRASLETQVAKAKKFARNLQRMRKMGYSNAIIQQVAAAGIEGGSEVAASLVAASKGDVKGISTAFTQINQTAKSTGSKLAGQMFDSGVQAANGVVAGLKAKRKAVERTLIEMAKAMQTALRKALGIKSPSKVFTQLGEFTGQGLANGITAMDKPVAKAAAGLARSATTGARGGLGDLGARNGAPGARGGLTPASLGVGRGTGGVHLEFKTYNPVAEPQSRTTNKALARVATLGLV